MFSDSLNEDPALYTLVDQEGEIYLYECNYSLPLGFMTNGYTNILEGYYNQETSNPLERQNNMVNALGIASPLFVGTGTGSDGTSTTIIADVSGHYYAHVGNSRIDTLKLNSEQGTKSFTKLKNNYICDLGWYEAGSTIYLSSEDSTSLELSAYRLDISVLDTALSLLSEQSMTVDSFDSSHIKGHITVEEAGDLILSVPGEPGWSVLVNGKETETQLFADTFILLSLEEGTHSIELRYRPDGFIAGMAVSLTCLAAFLVLSLPKRRSNPKGDSQR